MKLRYIQRFTLYSVVSLLITACSVNKFIPEGNYLLNKVTIRSDNPSVKTDDFNPYVRQNPNARWFSLFRLPMYIYSLSWRDSTNRFNRFLQKIGDKPVIYSEQKALETKEQIQMAVRNLGYMGATVDLYQRIHKNRISILYDINTHAPYRVDSIVYAISDPAIREKIVADTLHSYLHKGMLFDVNRLDAERQRIAENLQSNGYFGFNKEYLVYEADTFARSKRVGLRLKLNNDSLRHRQYTIRSVNYLLDTEITDLSNMDTAQYQLFEAPQFRVFYKDKLFLRKNVLSYVSHLLPGDLYNYKEVQDTYTSLGRLNILKFYNIRFQEQQRRDSLYLDTYILLTRNKNKSLSFEIEGTNSAGDLGAAASVSYAHRNLFRGSEVFTVRARGAYEAVTGLEGYANRNYTEYGIESSLNFPRFVFPFISDDFKKHVSATSEVSAKYNWQIRPEFSRTVASAGWSYKWNVAAKHSHRFDVLDINYIYMPERSQAFIDYLKAMDDINPLLRYSYENQFIIRMGYTYTYNSLGLSALQAARRNSFSFRFNIEESGNLMYAFSRLVHKTPRTGDSFRMGNISFAQYLKLDLDFTKNFYIDERNTFVLHSGIGVAYPYGNSKSLPFEKLYFSGGANSVRGWSVRSLGPGAYAGLPNRLDYVNHTGDLKFDFNVEYRTHLFWKLNGAAFIDAGNIWTLRKRELQPEGYFRLNEFYKQIAVAYGLGIRFDFDFLILRFDGGMKAINPIYTGKDRFPILSPRFGRDFAFHFAVGYPF